MKRFITGISIAVLALLAPASNQFQLAEHPEEFTIKDLSTVFVFEYIRHGARSHYEDNVDMKEFFGAEKKGYVTPKGKADHYRIGQSRRREYVY